MDFDDAKENIQPLATGRNASILQASLHESPQKLLAQRRELEQAIHNYSGDDPLEPWYTYISWIEQSFPSGGKESGLEEVLTKCISRFEAEERYYQDRRMIKLYMKFLDNHKHPTECFQQLCNAGIGTMVADFYICWAYYYDLCGNTRKADEIFRRGIACRAQPLEELQEAHQHFGFTVAQRIMYQDDEDVKESTNRQLHERRLALTSLRGHRRKAVVGSVRTGAAVKSYKPGTVQIDAPSTSRQCNARVSVFHDENASPNLPESLQTTVEPPVKTATPEEGKSVVRSIIDAALNQENQKEPGPWNKAHDKKKSGKLFSKSKRPVDLGFDILEDDASAEDAAGSGSRTQLQPPITEGVQNHNKPFKYPTNFASRNLPQPEWHTPVTIENETDARAWAQYNKCLLYPRPNMELQPEELRAYYWLKRRGITNTFTQKRDVVWRNRDADANVRQYPNFVNQSRPQKLDALDAFFKPERKPHMTVAFDELYDTESKEEYQWEELIARRLRRNATIAAIADMEETMCMPSDRLQRRKSFLPLRRSIAPRALPPQVQVSYLTAERDVQRNQEQAEDVRPKPLKTRDSLATYRKEQQEKTVSLAATVSKGVKLFDEFEEISANIDPAVCQETQQQKQETAIGLQASYKEKVPEISKVLKSTESVSTALRKENVPFEVFEDTISLSTGSCRAKSTEVPVIAPTASISTAFCKDNVPFEVFEDTISLSTGKCSVKSTEVAAIVSQKDDTTSVPGSDCKLACANLKNSIPLATVATPKDGLPFEIYEDATTGFTTAAIAASTTCQDVVRPSDFKFKTPAPPVTGVKGAKLPFEIYTEETAAELENIDNAACGCFDAEETCSTQTFNVFLKMQLVSTPKVPQKVAPRQFGTLLESSTAVASEQSNEQAPKNVDAPENVEIAGNVAGGTAITQYSPMQPKQLSTILETSEHGTTQGTHTTGGTSTKSTISSPETEGDQQTARPIMRHVELETLQEQSRESSTSAVIASMENVKLQSTESPCDTVHVDAEMRDLTVEKPPLPHTSDTHEQLPVPATPADGRLQLYSTDQAPLMSSLNFSIFEDDRTGLLKPKQAGNFTRIDEREDTAAGYTVRSVRFQEDKTETISKMLLISRQDVRFQEDKTDTISKMLLLPPAALRFEEDKTDTLPRIPLQVPNLPAASCVINLDESFEFFGESPPVKNRFKSNGGVHMGFADTPSPLAKRFCEKDTPLVHAPTQNAEKRTDRSTVKQRMPLFKDEMDMMTEPKPLGKGVSFSGGSALKPTKQPVVQSLLRDSFLPDFSMIEDTQPQPAQNVSTKCTVIEEKLMNATKSQLSGSHLKDFSEIAESQAVGEQVAQSQAAKSSTAKVNHGDSYLKDFSTIIDSQPVLKTADLSQQRASKDSHSQSFLNDRAAVSSQPEKSERLQAAKSQTAKANLGDSYLKDFSTIMDSQPAMKTADLSQQRASKGNRSQSFLNDGATVSSQPEKSERLQAAKSQTAKANLGDSCLKDFSIVMDSQPQDFGNKWRPNKSSNQKTAQTAITSENAEKSNLGASYLKDFSMSLQSQTDKLQSTLPKTVKSNMGTSFLNDFSMAINSQPVKSNLSTSYLKDFSMEKNSQPAKANVGTSYADDFSMVMDSQQPNVSAMWRPNKSTNQKNQSPQVAKSNWGDSYLKDFSSIVETQPLKNEILWHKKKSSVIGDMAGMPNSLEHLDNSGSNSQKANALLKVLNESKRQHERVQRPSQLKPPTKLSFLETFKSACANERTTATSNVPLRRSGEQCFELNAETEMFATNNSMIKNSTWLPQHEQSWNAVQFKEQSLHIKSEPIESKESVEVAFKAPLPLSTVSTGAPKLGEISVSNQQNCASGSINKISSMAEVTSVLEDEPPQEVDDNAELSIYYKHTPKTPKIEQHVWAEETSPFRSPTDIDFVHSELDLNHTQQVIDHICGGPDLNPNINPFNSLLLTAFLDQIDFTKYIEELPNCQLVGKVSRLHGSMMVQVCDKEFNVLKLVAEGGYGAVYCGVDKKTGKKYALKQERPPNFWEYYICLEIQSRLHIDEMLSAFMSVDYALIGNNASVLISSFSSHGSLINVCNKVKKFTMKNVDEYVVMLLTCELLDILDHLHAVSIIHADIKATNFLLMKKLSYPCTEYALQLIDFGVSIDMKLFKTGQTFNYVHSDNAFKCVEMREDRPWTYQLDLYGLAGVIHVLLFGKYMEIAQRTNGTWMHRTHVPRYFNKPLWETIFSTLLNIRDCASMPNLQQLRALLKEELAEKEKFVQRKVYDFNMALTA